MRAAYKGVEIIRSDDGEFLGLSLGFDFCAEHEHGINPMRDALGVGTLTEKSINGISIPITRGVQARQINITPEELAPQIILKDNNKGKLKYTTLLFSAYMSEDSKHLYEDTIKSHLSLAKSKYNSQELMSSWSEKGFCVSGFNDEFRDAIRQIYTAFQNNDIVFGGSLKTWINSSGLSLLIASKIPKETHENLIKADIDQENLLKAVKDSKIEQILEKAGKRYFALSPKWKDFFKEPKYESEYPVVFWLNPYDQKNNAYGWYTVEELKQWANNSGPVIEKQKEKRLKM